jgi:polar amino acid transport system substrate-binding protein
MVAALASLTLTACGASTSKPEADPSGPCTPAVTGDPLVPPTARTVKEDATLAAEVPAADRGKTIQVAVPQDLPGVNFTYNGTRRGFEPDLLNAAAAELGVKLNYVLTNDLASAFTSGQVTAAAYYLNDTKEREKAGLQFVNYLQATDAALVANCNPQKIKSNSDLCGKTVTAIKGSTQLAAVSAGGAVTKLCADAGKAAPKALPAESTAAAITTVGTTADVALVDGPIAQAAAQSTPDKLSVGYITERPGQPTSFAFVDPALAKAFDDALNALMSDGTYTKVLDDYNISQGRMDKATLNGATA